MHQKFVADRDLLSVFRHTCDVCKNLLHKGLLDEETTTGAILGAMAASYPILATTKGQSKINWHRYNKSSARDPNSEARNGADFTLWLLGDEGNSRVAIFQAKKSAVRRTASGWRVDVRHESTDLSGNPCAQMVALAELADQLLRTNQTPAVINPKNELGHLEWIHYLLYGPSEPLCIPLSRMSDLYPAEKNLQGSRNEFTFVPKDEKTFLKVLSSGINQNTKQWLTVKTKELFKMFPAWISISPIIVASTENGWDFVPANRTPSKGRKRTQATKPARQSTNRSKI
ncbi:hypothetical protein [Xanthomonas phaseoli]|nr:hypothetical protein [Xanthomonas perforans]RWU18650.1 hypothetical protein XANMN_08440 [Xanthomonas phaseoli pv. manihotis str. CIO151]